MSKIGKKPIIIPDNINVKINGGFLDLNCANNNLKLKIPSNIKTEIKDKSILFSAENNSKQTKACWGTIRALTFNAIVGIAQGFDKILEIEGVGFRANMEGDVLVLSLGFSHPVKFIPPENIKILVNKNVIKISGIDKALVGQTAAKIRALKKPEPYKGKGIRYQGEVIRRKAVKKATTGAAK